MSKLEEPTGPKCFGTTQRKSFVDQFDRDIPGPGTYQPARMDRIENPEWVIGTQQQRNSFIDQHRFGLPAPNIYHPNYAAVEKQPKKYSIQGGKLDSRSVESFAPQIKPDISVIKTQYPQYSFGYAFQQDYDNKLPGVGSYMLKDHKAKFNRTQNHFGTGNRSPPHGEQGKFPSATKYNTIDFNRTTKYSFPKTERVIPKKIEEPKAKFYDIGEKRKATSNNRFYDIKAKKRQTMLFSVNQNPGPNHYTPYQPTKIPAGAMQNSQRSPAQIVPILSYPSADKYAGEEVLKKDKKGCSFVRAMRKLTVEEKTIPGPGTYEPASTFRSIGGAIGKSREKQDDETTLVTPGANHYRPKASITRAKAKSTIVFRSDRCDFSKTITGAIGPGQYELQKDHTKAQSVKIGTSRRPELYSPSKNPGVGNYNIPAGIGRLPQYYTSPKKMTETGYSTFHEKLRIKMMQKQRRKQLEQQKEQKQEQLEQSASQSQVKVAENIEE